MKKTVIATPKAPKAVGPYSQGIAAKGFVFCSGQIALKPDGTLVTGDIREQARQVLMNLQEVLKAAGATMQDVVKTTIYLTDIGDFAAVNEVYATFFEEPFPARVTVGVAKLPKGAGVEIEATAWVG